jgi:primosomal protein N' (replication factor Y)
MPPILRIAIPSPLRRLFDYLPPEGMDPLLAAELPPGVRVRVPFGPRQLTGILVACTRESERPAATLRRALAVLDAAPQLSPPVFALCQWAADYYLHPPGEVFSTALSKPQRQGRMPPQPAWRLSAHGLGLAEGALRRAPRQAEVLQILRSRGSMSHEVLREAGVSTTALRELARKGLIERCAAPPPAAPALRAQPPVLNTAQSAVVQTVAAAYGGFSAHLIEGVTGSGKTEVYLQLISRCLERGAQALLLVPEISLTPQTAARFADRFHSTIAVLHSGLSDGERAAAWEQARSGAAPIIIGTRSAVFVSCRQLGLLIVDEEHDASYKQQDGFRYHARDIAVKRAQLERCPVLLGSATPSLESLHNALSGRYKHHLLGERAGGSALPDVQLIDVRAQPLEAGLSAPLLAAARETLAAGRQVLLFLNRRGYASALRCHDCGWIAGCAHCDARLTVHRRQRQLRCHHCAAQQPLPAQCPHCGSAHLLTSGLGTQQTEEYLEGALGAYPLHRVDRDAVANHQALQDLLEAVGSGEPCILLGTQMLSKGHHFPAVTLVGVIDSDALLFSGDFRGEEQLAQLLTQVAGRAGRAGHPGRVLLQTHYPHHPLFERLLGAGYAGVARELLAQRQGRALPPVGRLCMLRADAEQAGAGEQFLRAVRRRLGGQLPPGTQLIGPLPSAMPRRAGRYRSQLLCLCHERRSAAQSARLLVAAAEAQPASPRLHWFLDVDPTEVL